MNKTTLILATMLCINFANATEYPDSVSEPITLSLNEITVSGIKHSNSVTDKAAIITTVGREQVERNGIMTARQISDFAPNFFIPDYGSRMTSTIYVRGLGARIDHPTMGLNIDNIPVMCKENYDFDLIDISRAETLRGPQSTLYGRNTMGGLMNIYTISPLNYSGFRALAEYGSHGHIKAGVGYYFKPIDNLGIGISGQYTGGNGEFTNQYNGKKCDWERGFSGRVKTEWIPKNNVLVSNSLIVGYSRQGGYPYKFTQTGEIAYNDTCFYRRTSIMDGLTVSHDFGPVKFSSITSYQYLNDNMTLDQDFTPLPYFTLTQARKEHSVTQDLVIKSNDKNSSKYQWLAGMFGFYRCYKMSAPVTFKDTGISELIERHRNQAIPEYPISWDERNFLLGSDFTSPTWGIAAYHESQLTLGKFILTAGMRIDYERSTLNYASETHTGYNTWKRETGELYFHSDIDIDDSGKLKKDFIQILPKFSVVYQPRPDATWNLFATISKGYKAGGFNTQMFSDVLQQRLMRKMGIGANYQVDDIVGYKPEIAWNYEMGAHISLFKGKLLADVNAFYIDCRDRQLTVFPDGTTTGRVMTNAGKTRSTGVELSAIILPESNTRITASYGYCNAKFVEYNDGKADHKGNFIPYSPSHTLWCEAGHRFNISKSWLSSITVAANMRGVGEIWWNESNSLRQPFYALLGANVTLTGKRYSLQLWGRNLTGTEYSTFYFVSISHEFLQRGKGRAIGATLRINI